MAVAFEDSVENYNASTSSISCSASASRSAGDFMLLVRIQDSASRNVTSEDSDWTTIGTLQTTSDHRAQFYYRIADGTSADDYSATLSGSTNTLIVILRWSGVDQTTPIDQSSVGQSASGTSHSTGSITPSIDDSTLVGAFTMDSSQVRTWTFDAPSGVTERYDNNNNGAFIGCAVGDAPGPNPAAAETVDATVSNGLPSATCILALTPASSGTNLTPSGLDHSRSIGTGPKVNPSLGPASLVHTRSLGAPKVNPSIPVASLEHTRALGAPAVILLLKPVGLEHTRSIAPAPQVNTTIGMTGLDHGRALGSPQVTLLLGPSGLAHTRALGSPRVDPKLTPAGLDHGRALGSPTVSGSSQVSPAGLEHTRALGSPTLFPNLFPASLVHTRALGAPFIPAMPASLVHTRALGAPHVDVVLTPAGLDHGRALGTTGVTTSGSGPESIYDSGNYPYGYTH